MFMKEEPAVHQGPTVDVLFDVYDERQRQIEKWGHQSHADGTGRNRDDFATGFTNAEQVDYVKNVCDHAHERGEDRWCLILGEELFEALCEEDLDNLRKELVQVAAVAVAWIEDIDARTPVGAAS